MESTTYTYSYSSSRWSGYVVLLLSLVVVIVVAFGLVNHTAKLEATLFLLAIAGVFAWLGLRTVSRKLPELQFGPDSIWTPKLGDVKWQRVVLGFDHVTTGKAGTIYVLKILDRATRQQLDWIAFGVTSAESNRAKEALYPYKKAQFS